MMAETKTKTQKTKTAGKLKKIKIPKKCFKIECKKPVEDGIMKIEDFVSIFRYFQRNFSLQLKFIVTETASNGIKVASDETDIVVTTGKIPFSKRYLKFLTVFLRYFTSQ